MVAEEDQLGRSIDRLAYQGVDRTMVNSGMHHQEVPLHQITEVREGGINKGVMVQLHHRLLSPHHNSSNLHIWLEVLLHLHMELLLRLITWLLLLLLIIIIIIIIIIPCSPGDHLPLIWHRHQVQLTITE